MFPFTLHFSPFNYPLDLGAYTLFFLLAAIIGVIGSLFFAIKRGFNGTKVAITLLIMLLAAVIGARLLNALVNLSAYIQEPSKLLTFSASGFSLYGGIVFAVISGLICCRLFKLDTYKLGDTCIPFLGLSIATMRIGCFLNGCCFGKETDSFWGITFPFLSPAHIDQITDQGNYFEVAPVHPTQLYELVAAILLSTAAFGLLKKKQPDGITMLIFLTGLSVFRLFNSYLRVNLDTYSLPLYFYPALYVVLILLCLILIKIRYRTFSPDRAYDQSL
ncbi:MAG: prolipoprotein diacylglyceryl transferase [Candidatus Abawacabacteria bacterium]|nr:prolipoprotein diacylglyceryl transferase [Candidatus Abawacabacteria bacterium]